MAETVSSQSDPGGEALSEAAVRNLLGAVHSFLQNIRTRKTSISVGDISAGMLYLQTFERLYGRAPSALEAHAAPARETLRAVLQLCEETMIKMHCSLSQDFQRFLDGGAD